MNQLYKIGIIVAILLLILLGLQKLNTQTGSEVESPEIKVEESKQESTNETTMQQEQQNGNKTVVMKTNKGDITIELYTDSMPITAGNFLKLAQEDFYDGVKFHRVIDGFMIQGGDPNSKDDSKQSLWGTGGPGYKIEDEFVDGLSNVRGTLAMANSGPNTGGSQFFINTVDNTFLDGKHPVFGAVKGGIEIVDQISTVTTDPRDVPIEPVIINDIVIQ